jgi:hypothetical protein
LQIVIEQLETQQEEHLEEQKMHLKLWPQQKLTPDAHL